VGRISALSVRLAQKQTLYPWCRARVLVSWAGSEPGGPAIVVHVGHPRHSHRTLAGVVLCFVGAWLCARPVDAESGFPSVLWIVGMISFLSGGILVLSSWWVRLLHIQRTPLARHESKHGEAPAKAVRALAELRRTQRFYMIAGVAALAFAPAAWLGFTVLGIAESFRTIVDTTTPTPTPTDLAGGIRISTLGISAALICLALGAVLVVVANRRKRKLDDLEREYRDELMA
jgi:MFS family permease